MKILVTGARGFTGQWFCRLARERGHQIIDPECDLRDGPALSGLLRDLEFTHVVHLAAISFAAHGDSEAVYQVNLLGTLHLLEALKLRDCPVERILLASSANIYGNAVISPVTESVCPAPVNHYANSKLAMEGMAKTYLDRLPIFLTRPFNYTGPGQSASFLIPKLVHHFASRAPVVELGNLDVEREFNDVRMVCEAYLRLLERSEVGGVYNICTGLGYSLKAVLACLKDLTNHPIEVKVNPDFVRANEVHRLVGDPGSLHATVGALPAYSIRDTLAHMLDAAMDP